MALPVIKPYDLPVDLPENRTSWRVEPERVALLVHDMQNHFLAPFESAPIPEVIDNILALRELCVALGIPVHYSAQPGGQTPGQRGLLTDFWGHGLGGEPHAAAIVDALKPGDPSAVLTKWRYSAFVRTDLAERLGSRDQLLIVGVYAHIGVQATALDAFMRDIQPFVVADAVADFSPAHHRAALEYTAQRCGQVHSTKRMAQELTAVRS
ncbi:bifunctional isochorismate lyase/aryl carrier protein [Streptosporangium becharense]|uniref:Bifunctional isochorismate lyase/aryl carrier protein n=1 Tax=Streptosporangium becharense TaxID=1816182 RepID=A0A7W9IB68_9ACTN|nr:isochorismatase family protein [Streptosporangium becharense]MBB2910629.1 bifunctional isochorismate lyase/aryl carrier protein [Streptosporangium becharense]MBB5817325.1 bifunctional isochorismate lyase/aryl carrier protein [Streptosporangium becharense]